ncbi:MAG: hypothetical protein AAGJ81_03350 [Verrucomicrobiota bacterium]
MKQSRSTLKQLTCFAFVAIVFIAPVLPASAEIKPDAKVQSFTFRKFNDRGLRLWDLSGNEAVFLSDSIIRVIEMQLAVTSTASGKDTVLRSPSANIFVEDNSASGEGLLFVQGAGYSLEGEDWEWKGAERRIDIRRGARVTFDEAIDRILK